MMNEIKCLDHGFVRLVDVMGDDKSIVQAARISYGEGTKTISQDRGLIRYLMRHSHTSPFEMVEFKFHCKMPMFVARQWVRHRTANVNEVSGRYSILPAEDYLPDEANISFQSIDNKQGRSSDQVPNNVLRQTLETLKETFENSQKAYESMNDNNIARELARICLPLSRYTEWYWKMDLNNLLHFLKLRLDKHSQYEIRVFAEAIRELIKPIVPITWEAFEDYSLSAQLFSGPELRLLKKLVREKSIEFPEEAEKISKREMLELKNLFSDEE